MPKLISLALKVLRSLAEETEPAAFTVMNAVEIQSEIAADLKVCASRRDLMAVRTRPIAKVDHLCSSAAY
ncbi:hypothetical protein [Rhizobium lusitanum]|uniref:Uncharacterized protein n=1 Tax=Rhizobium lusitanum TaxID=293958 RepID=A0A7X0ISP4_9HYPH|nr:hypothetical protein [Rhizobium lusitanum]MBB6486042.1 hypothetical protein [Rhizobium lusitanum]